MLIKMSAEKCIWCFLGLIFLHAAFNCCTFNVYGWAIYFLPKSWKSLSWYWKSTPQNWLTRSQTLIIHLSVWVLTPSLIMVEKPCILLVHHIFLQDHIAYEVYEKLYEEECYQHIKEHLACQFITYIQIQNHQIWKKIDFTGQDLYKTL